MVQSGVMGPLTLKNIVKEAELLLLGAVISKVSQPDERRVILKLFSRGRDFSLLISARPDLPRMHLTGKKYKNPPAPPRFCALLRSRITNARVEALSVVPGEAVSEISLRRKTDDGTELHKLVIELTGKSSNIILTDGAGIVVDALKLFDSEDSVRKVLPGELLAPLPPGRPPKELLTGKTASTWNETAEEVFNAIEDASDLKLEKSRLERSVKARVKKTRKKIDNLHGDMERAKAAIERSHLAENLVANFSSLKRGMKEVKVTDYYKDPPVEVTVPLDPKLSPQENIDTLFKRVKKGKKTLVLTKERLPSIEKELAKTEEWLEKTASVGTLQELAELKDGLQRAGYIPKDKAAQKGRGGKAAPQPKPGEPVKTIIGPEGFTILYGKSSAGNDLLVKKYGRKRDLWFHARDSPGAHVLLKVEGAGREPSRAVIEEAARIAAKLSREKHAGKVEVICAEMRFVRKPRGSKPGQVTVERFKSILIDPDKSGFISRN